MELMIINPRHKKTLKIFVAVSMCAVIAFYFGHEIYYSILKDDNIKKGEAIYNQGKGILETCDLYYKNGNTNAYLDCVGLYQKNTDDFIKNADEFLQLQNQELFS